MIELNNKLVVYHGSYVEVKSPDLSKCNPFRDFGCGFYVTTSKEQAKNFINISLKKAKAFGLIRKDSNSGYISVYELKITDNLSFLEFENAEVNWLHCIAGNRKHEIFIEDRKKYDSYDVLAGKIANDQTNATLTAYLMGLYGKIGSDKADNECISHLLPERLQNQICLKNEKALNNLIFKGSEKICMKI